MTMEKRKEAGKKAGKTTALHLTLVGLAVSHELRGRIKPCELRANGRISDQVQMTGAETGEGRKSRRE